MNIENIRVGSWYKIIEDDGETPVCVEGRRRDFFKCVRNNKNSTLINHHLMLEEARPPVIEYLLRKENEKQNVDRLGEGKKGITHNINRRSANPEFKWSDLSRKEDIIGFLTPIINHDWVVEYRATKECALEEELYFSKIENNSMYRSEYREVFPEYGHTMPGNSITPEEMKRISEEVKQEVLEEVMIKISKIVKEGIAYEVGGKHFGTLEGLKQREEFGKDVDVNIWKVEKTIPMSEIRKDVLNKLQ